MSTVLAATSNPAQGSTFSTAQAWLQNAIVTATCANGPGLLLPCQAVLLASADSGASYVEVDRKPFVMSTPTDSRVFRLFDYASVVKTNPVEYWLPGPPPTKARAGMGYPSWTQDRTWKPPWDHFIIGFVGNDGGACTVASTLDS